MRLIPNAFDGIKLNVGDVDVAAPEFKAFGRRVLRCAQRLLPLHRIAVQAVVDENFHRGAVDVDVHREGKARWVLRRIELAVQGVAVEVVVNQRLPIELETSTCGIGKVERKGELERVLSAALASCSFKALSQE